MDFPFSIVRGGFLLFMISEPRVVGRGWKRSLGEMLMGLAWFVGFVCIVVAVVVG